MPESFQVCAFLLFTGAAVIDVVGERLQPFSAGLSHDANTSIAELEPSVLNHIFSMFLQITQMN